MSLFRRKPLGWEASLKAVQAELATARDEVTVLAEQLASLREDADEANVRSLVSSNTADIRDARQATGHADRLEKGLRRQRDRVRALEAEEEELLNRPLFDE